MSKLNQWGDGPFQVPKRVNDNAYRLDMSDEYEVNVTFNVSDLIPFAAGTNDEAKPTFWRTNPL